LTDQPRSRAAVVVIHGIGEQPPLSTLGRFAQGLVDNAGVSQPEPVLRHLAGETVPVLRFSGLRAGGDVDVLEFSWQHLIQGRAGSLRTLRWLLGTTLAPLDFRRHWRVLAAAGTEAPSPWLVVLRQLLIAGALLLPVLAAPAFLVLAWFWVADRLGTGLPPRLNAGAWEITVFLVSLVAGVLALVQLIAVVRDAITAARLNRHVQKHHGTGWHGLHGGEAKRWRVPAFVLTCVLLLAAVLLGWLSLEQWAGVSDWLTDPAGRDWLTGTLFVIAGIAIAAHFLRWLRDYVGDIALYVTADWQPAASRSRDLIKEAAARLLEGLLRDPGYDRIVIVGHSLGSVIAFDALNLLSRNRRLENVRPPAPLEKLTGLLTFGSPLDKVAYFFREETDDGAAIHAQLLSFMHPTKRLPSRRDDGPYRLKGYEVPFKDLRWVNLHAPLDAISDPLVFYGVTERMQRNYFPAGSHGRYWRDSVTYEWLLRMLSP